MTMQRAVAGIFCALAGALPATTASAFFGEIWDYVSQYQFGIDYTSSYDSVSASYVTARDGDVPKHCAENGDDAATERCSVTMKGGGSSGLGFFLQQAFKKQGTYYFKPDVGFGVHYLHGSLTDADKQVATDEGLPLKDLDFSLLAVILKPYVKLGVTPDTRFLPDVFLSIGPAAEVAFGKVAVNGQERRVAMATYSGNSVLGGFFELEIVPLRFGDGALSVFTSSEFSGGGNGTKFYPKDVDGMSDFRGDFTHSVSGGVHGFGLKLVTPWP